MGNLKTRYMREDEYASWNDFVEKSPEGTIFHRSDWLSNFGEFFLIGCFNKNNEIVAGMPCFVKTKLFMKTIVNPPLTPYQGIIYSQLNGKYVRQISARKKMSQEIIRFLLKEHKNVAINVSPQVLDIQPYIWNGFKSSVRYTYILKLDDLNKVKDNVEKELRTAIKKATKDKFEVITTENFKMFFNLVNSTFKRQNKQASFKEYAEKINHTLKNENKCKILLTMKNNKPIGGVYIIHDSKRAYYLLGGYDSDDSHYGASAQAMWEAIKYTKNKLGLNEFDFEGSMIQPVERFFRQFGGELRPYYTVVRYSWVYSVFLQLKNTIKTFIGR